MPAIPAMPLGMGEWLPKFSPFMICTLPSALDTYYHLVKTLLQERASITDSHTEQTA